MIKDISSVLKIGELYSYHELATKLKEPYHRRGGNVKKQELEDWQRYITFVKVGKKYKITEILDKPLPKPVKASNAKYINLLWYMIIEFNRRWKQDCVIDFRSSLMCKFGFYCEDFYLTKRDRGMNEAVEFITAPLNKAFDSAMNSLSKKGVIAYSKYLEAKDLSTQTLYELSGDDLEAYNYLRTEAIHNYFKKHNKPVPRKNPIGIISLTNGWIEYSNLLNDAVESKLNIRVFNKVKYQILDSNLTYNQTEIDEILEPYSDRLAYTCNCNYDEILDPIEIIGKEINRRANALISNRFGNIDNLIKLQDYDKTIAEIQELLDLNQLDISSPNSTPISDFADKRFNHAMFLSGDYDYNEPDDYDCMSTDNDVIQDDYYNEIAEYYSSLDNPNPQQTSEQPKTEEFTLGDYINMGLPIPAHLQEQYEQYLFED